MCVWSWPHSIEPPCFRASFKSKFSVKWYIWYIWEVFHSTHKMLLTDILKSKTIYFHLPPLISIPVDVGVMIDIEGHLESSKGCCPMAIHYLFLDPTDFCFRFSSFFFSGHRRRKVWCKLGCSKIPFFLLKKKSEPANHQPGVWFESTQMDCWIWQSLKGPSATFTPGGGGGTPRPFLHDSLSRQLLNHI